MEEQRIEAPAVPVDPLAPGRGGTRSKTARRTRTGKPPAQKAPSRRSTSAGRGAKKAEKRVSRTTAAKRKSATAATKGDAKRADARRIGTGTRMKQTKVRKRTGRQ